MAPPPKLADALPAAPSRLRRPEVVFAAGIVVFAVVAFLSARSLRRVETDVNWVNHTREVLLRLTAVRLDVAASEDSRRGFVIVDDRSEQAQSERSASAAEADVAELQRLTRDNPSQRDDLRDLVRGIAQWRAVLREADADFERNGFSRDTQAAFIRQGRLASEGTSRALGRIESREQALLDSRQKSAGGSARATAAIVISGSVIGVALLLGAAAATVREATARRTAQRVLRLNEERHRLILDGVRDYAIFMLDPRGRIVTWSEGARRLKGYSAGEVIGRPHTIFYIPEAIRDGVPDEFLASARLEGHAENEGWRVRKDGTRFWADVVLTALESDGQIVGFAKITRDMTERRAADEAIAALNDDLKHRAAELTAANDELQTFCYSVSHDLRSPLRAIDGFSQAIEEDERGRLSDSGRRLLGRVRAAAQRMAELIDALLDLSRVTRQPLVRTRVDLSAVARGIVDELERTHPERRVAVTVARDLAAEGDERLLRLVFQNLIGNAWKFTAETSNPEIAVGAEPSPETVYFIRDNGAGFDMQYVGQLFAPFHRLHGANEFPGTGIGLATVARIVQRHGGRIWAEGKVNEGAAFYFTL